MKHLQKHNIGGNTMISVKNNLVEISGTGRDISDEYVNVTRAYARALLRQGISVDRVEDIISFLVAAGLAEAEQDHEE